MFRVGGALLLTAAIIGASIIGAHQPANAATCAAPGGGFPSIAGSLTSNSGCQLGTTNNDSLTQVNADNLFGHSDWVSVPGGGDVNATSGTWTLAANFFSIYDAGLVVLKDGNGIPSVYVGYLILAADGTSGTYTSPFKNPNNGNLKDVSHINYYGWIDPTPNPAPGPVPLPPAALLFVSALGGLGLLGVRRRRKA